jgi:hypothetical protein
MEIIQETRGENVDEKIMDKQAVLQLDKVLNLHDFQFLEKWGRRGIKFREFDVPNCSLLESDNFVELGGWILRPDLTAIGKAR